MNPRLPLLLPALAVALPLTAARAQIELFLVNELDDLETAARKVVKTRDQTDQTDQIEAAP